MRKYPLHLGQVPRDVVNTPIQKAIIAGSEAKHCPALGEVNETSIPSNEPVLKELSRLCDRSGLALSEKPSGLFLLRGYVFGAGSVYPHDDDGMGLTAAVFVAASPIAEGIEEWDYAQDCWFFGGGTSIQLRVGDAFAFNSDKEHTFMSNCRWVLAIHGAHQARKK
jgi:hypothetical protein